MQTRAVVGAMVLGVVVLGGCRIPGVPTPDPEPAPMLQLAITPFPALNPCILGCNAATTVTVTNGGDAATSTGVVVTTVATDPVTAIVFPGVPACEPANVLDPGESCTMVLSVSRLIAGVPDPGIASGTVTATSGSDFESETFSVTLGP